jgi:hypothetical protein
MPHLVDVRELENCLQRSESREVALDSPVTEELMRRLAGEGALQYFPHFPRPYFRIDHPSAWVVQGIIGDCKLRIQLFGESMATTMERLRWLIEE